MLLEITAKYVIDDTRYLYMKPESERKEIMLKEMWEKISICGWRDEGEAAKLE